MQASISSEPPTQLAAAFNLDDADERFMFDVLHRFHTETPGLYVLHALRRTVHNKDGQVHRRLLTVTSFHSRRRDAIPEWNLIAWDVDAVSIQLTRCSDRAAARAAFDAA